MPTLRGEIKVFIVQSLACYETPTQVVESVQVEFGVTLARSHIQQYDPTKRAGKDLGKKFVELFNSTRKTFLESISEIPIAHQSFRLKALQRSYENGLLGATACICIPWFMDKYNEGADWRSLAYWIHDHLSYSELEFFDGKGMCSFNISWHESPKKNITSWMTPRVLLSGAHNETGFSDWYKDFPDLAMVK